MPLNASEICNLAKQTLHIEAQAIEQMQAYINQDFVQAVQHIYVQKGRVVLAGIGKSAIIAQKIAATLNSTGTPALFMHAADAIHGDLGMITPADTVIILSKSGNTPEIKVLIPLLKRINNTLVAIVGNLNSYLAKHAHYVLCTHVTREACPNNLAPTASTSAQLAMGDALAVCLLQMRGFTSTDFAKVHPGGSLGKQLYLTVNDMCASHEAPKVYFDTPLTQVIIEISSKRLGATAVLNYDNKLLGIITDGDLRRALLQQNNMQALQATHVMTPNPKTITVNALAIDALHLMRQHQITQIIVLEHHQYKGMVHIHDLLKEGLI